MPDTRIMQNEELIPWHRVKGEFGLYFINYIGVWNDKYYCHLCKKPIDSKSETYSHMENHQHLIQRNAKLRKHNLNAVVLPAFLFKTLVYNQIFPKSLTYYECMICGIKISGHQSVLPHIIGKNHERNKPCYTLDLALPQKQALANCVSNGTFNDIPQTVNSLDTLKSYYSSPQTINVDCISKAGEPGSNSNGPMSSPKQSNATSAVSKPHDSYRASPPRQFGSIIYKHYDWEDMKFICHLCSAKVGNRVLLHVHLTSHFWPRFAPNGMEAGVNVIEMNIPNVELSPTIINNGIISIDALSKCPTINTEKITEISTASPRTNRAMSLLQTLDNMNKKLAPSNNSIEDKQVLSKYPAINTEKNAEISTSSPRANRAMSLLQTLDNMKKKLAQSSTSTEDKQPVEPEELPKKLNHLKLTPMKANPKKDKSLKNVMKKPDIDSKGLNDYYDIYEIDDKQLQNIKQGVVLSHIKNKKDIYCLICRKIIPNTLQSLLEHLGSIKHCDYLQQMKQDHSKYKTFPDQWSDLALALQFMHDTSDEFVKCFICKISIPNKTEALQEHINTERHMKRCSVFISKSEQQFNALGVRISRDWYNVQRYWCVPCGLKSTSEVHFLHHLYGHKHRKNCVKFINYEELIFDYCATCTTLWYGFPITYAYHCECKMHKYHSKDNFYIVSELPKAVKKLMTIPEEIVNQIMLEMNRKASYEKFREAHLLKDLEAITVPRFDRAKVHAFGSRLSGLASPSSDFDVYLDCNKTYYWSNSRVAIEHYLKEVEKCMKGNNKIWAIDRTVLDTRIPIIKVHHKPTGLECDISFTNGLTVEKSKLIKAYCDKFPLCRKLIIFMKQWVNDCDLCGNNGISSFAIAWLVIYHLQTESILPSVAHLIELQGESRLIADWEIGAKKDFDPPLDNYSFNDLLKKFFLFYAQFDYRHEVLCPLMGNPIEKLTFEKPEDLPKNMELYREYVKIMKDPELFRIDSPMCLQDPIDLAQNITKAVKKFTVYRFKKFCSMSAQRLEES